MSYKICEISKDQRPYEKAQQLGIHSLTDAELLGIILRSGSTTMNSIELANTILNINNQYKGLISLNYLSREELIKISGIGNVKATLILSIAELSKRISATTFKSKIIYNNPASIADYFMEKCRYLSTEYVYALFFTSSNSLIKEITISKGTVNKSLFSPRELFIEALKYEAVYFVLVHNHPSGIPNPSKADITMTKNLVESGKIIGIELLDHIIIGDNCFVSLLERGLIK